MIRDDLAALNVKHDVFFSERSLIEGSGPGRRDHRGVAREGPGLRRPAAAAEGRAGRGLGGPRADAVPRHRLRRRRRPAAEEVGRQLHLFRLRHRLSQVEVRPRLPRHDRRLGRRPRRLHQAHAGGGEGGQRRQRRARRQDRAAREAAARRRRGEDVEAGGRVRHAARSGRRGRPRRRALHDALPQERRARSTSTSPR